MSRHKKSSKNLLAGLTNNKFVHANATSKSMEHLESDSSSPEIEEIFNPSNRHSVHHSNSTSNHNRNHNPSHSVKFDINLPLYIKMIDGKDKFQRTRQGNIQCMKSKQSIQSSLLFILKHEHVDEPVDNFVICYSKCDDGQDAKSIYDYNLLSVPWKDVKSMVLRQVKKSPTQLQPAQYAFSSYSKQANKQRMMHQTEEIRKADLILRDNLGPELFMELQKNHKAAYVEARYDLAQGEVPWHLVEARIYQAVYGDETKPISSTKPSTNPTPKDQQSNVSLTESMNTINSNLLNLTSTVQQLVQLLSYQPIHSATASTSSLRYDPRNSIDNNNLPRCVATLPTTISMALPSLGNDKEEND